MRNARNPGLTSVLLLLVIFSGCASTRAVTEQDLLERPPSNIRLYLNDGRLITLQPYVQAEGMLTGFGTEHARTGIHPFAGSVPLRNVQRMETDARESGTFLILGSGILAALVVWSMTAPPDGPIFLR